MSKFKTHSNIFKITKWSWVKTRFLNAHKLIKWKRILAPKDTPDRFPVFKCKVAGCSINNLGDKAMIIWGCSATTQEIWITNHKVTCVWIRIPILFRVWWISTTLECLSWRAMPKLPLKITGAKGLDMIL